VAFGEEDCILVGVGIDALLQGGEVISHAVTLHATSEGSIHHGLWLVEPRKCRN
jgi:hypothetical protein